MLDNFSIFLGTTIILFIFVICLVIFAPKNKTFFPIETYPNLKQIINNKEIIDKTFIRLGVDDDFKDEYYHYDIYNQDRDEIEWMEWPDKNTNKGNVQFFPLFLLKKSYKKNKEIFKELNTTLKKVKNIKAVYFVNMPEKALIKAHNGWKELSNSSLCYIYCFNSFCFSKDDCGISVEGDTKILKKEQSYIFDCSKNFTIYNKTFNDVKFLLIYLDRPKDVPDGRSEYQPKLNL